MCRATDAANARCNASTNLLRVCEESFGIPQALRASLGEPIRDDGAFDDYLRRIAAVSGGKQ